MEQGLKHLPLLGTKPNSQNTSAANASATLSATILLTDKPVIETMRTDLAKPYDRLSVAIFDIAKGWKILNPRNE